MKGINCLVLTPFSENGLRLKELLKETFSEIGINVVHPADLAPEKPLLKGVLELFNKTELLIADVSEFNPNILIEIGIAKGLELPIVILADQDAEIPMSLTSMTLIRYNREKGVDKELALNVVSALEKSDMLPRKVERKKQVILHKEQPTQISRNPFKYLSAESISHSIDTLVELFVPPPYFGQVCGPETVVLIGPRGCGKTMLLQMMRFQQQPPLKRENTIRGPSIAGFYVNFNTSFRYMGAEEAILSDHRKITIYFNLLFLQSLINELDILCGSGKITENDEHKILIALGKGNNISMGNLDSLSTLSSEITRYIQLIRAGRALQSPIETDLADSLFLSNLTTTLSKCTDLFSGYNIAYLLDDYANDWLPEEVTQTLNRIIFQRTPRCSFKIATIPGRFTLGPYTYVEPVHDYLLVNMTDISFSRLHDHTRFLQKILDRRLLLAQSPLDSKSLLRSETTAKYTVDYSGIEGLTRLCTGDYRTMIDICGRMITSTPFLNTPISRELQNSIIRSYSLELLNSLEQGFEWGEYVFNFLISMMAFSRKSYLASKKTNHLSNTRRMKIYIGFIIFKNLSSDSEKKLRWLIRSGVIQPLSSYTGDQQRFALRKIFLPAFEIPIKGARDFLLVDSHASEIMFNNPKVFWNDMAKRLIHDQTKKSL